MALNYAPHITLAIYDGEAPADLYSAFDSAFELLPQLTIRFEGLNYFEAPNALILWAEPRLPPSLAVVHEQIHRALGPGLSRPHYRPGAWVPHCSLATTIHPSRKNEAIALASQPITPVDVLFDVADCVSFLPVEVLRERVLAKSA